MSISDTVALPIPKAARSFVILGRMSTAQSEAQIYLERFYGSLRNLHNLELGQFRHVIMGVLNPTLRERLLTLNYHRAAIDVELLLTLKDTRQFQAISMLARTVFELAVEMKLISVNPDAAAKIDAFNRVEMLRAARQVVAFKETHPDAHFHYETQKAYIAAKGATIDEEQRARWPGRRKVEHWSVKTLRERARELGDPFDRIYEVHYPQLSWDAHSGVVSVLRATTESFVHSVGIAYTIAIDSYMKVLEVVAGEFGLSKIDPHLKDKIVYAKQVAFAKSQEEADQLRQAYGF
jgi:Family of unknown function (DUF5677)